ncbi:MAG: carboxypeptidase M32 [Planctomycetes bacterium]|nr:carboxypeptidase M32 [Planctomycetota bacterium]
MDSQSAYTELIQRFREFRLLESIGALVGWDQHTYMPPKGAGHRAEQMGYLAKAGHAMLTSPRIGELLSQLEGLRAQKAADAVEAVNLREIRRTYDRAVKMPSRLVEEIAKTVSQAQNVWAESRKNDHFASFAPWLEKIVTLKREEASAVGFTESPYDALLDEYEPGATAAQITRVFAELRADLIPLVAAVAAAGKRPRKDILTREFAVDRQHMFGQAAAAAIGFDFQAGRLDTTVHPFCSGIGPGDCRLTTRYHPRELNQGLFGILHEAGHGIYEQGLDTEHFGTPAGSFASLGIHESQSRLWENQVGRGLPFWQHFYPRLQQTYAGTLDDVELADFYFAINNVEKSFIRVEADEATYNMHIILRFELEQALMTGDLKPSDVPGAWNQKFKQMLDLAPPNDAQGCLQDIHWSMGGLGYFPTYTLGNLYAAQFMQQAHSSLGGLDEDFQAGRFGRLKAWLNEKIHRPGQRYRAADLCLRVTNQPLSHRPLIAYLRKKYEPLYGI